MDRRKSRAYDKLFQAANELQHAGRAHAAIGYYQRAIQANGNVADVHNNLACAFLELGRFDEAAAALRKALALRPEYAAALDNLGLVHARLEQPEEAVALHERAAALEPVNATFQVHLGYAHLALLRYADAQAAFERAIRVAPSEPAAHNGRGIALDHLGLRGEAETAFRTALAINPTFADAGCNLGWVLVIAGDIAGATSCFERALALEPRNGRFHLSLVLSRSGVVDGHYLAELERLGAEIDALPRTQRIDLHFALANAHENVGRYDEAFRHLDAGNALKRGSIRYDEAETLRFSALLERAFTEPFVAAMRGWGNPSERPIFVFGMPRSGTTLVEQLLAAHPAIVGAGELPVLGLLARELWQAIADGMPFAELGSQIRTLGDRYLSATDELAGDAANVTDKMPGNFWYAPLIHLALPNARMIHVRRDRLDTCVSCFATLFADQLMPYAYDLGELARYYRAYEAMMMKWRTFLPADRFIEVHYERLVDDFEAEARRLVAFCGRPWDARTLAFHEVKRMVRTASNVQVRRPLYRSSVGRGQRFGAHLSALLPEAP